MKFPEKDELVTRYQQYSDDEILAIIKRQQDYQGDAVEAAREIAEQRGLDLSGIDAEETGVGMPALFPSFTSMESARKLMKSLQRILYLVALVPFITAALSLTDGYPSLAFAYAATAVLWGALAFFAVKRLKHNLVMLMFVLLFCMLVMRYMTSGLPAHLNPLDWTVVGIATFMLLYVLFYFKYVIRAYASLKNI